MFGGLKVRDGIVGLILLEPMMVGQRNHPKKATRPA